MKNTVKILLSVSVLSMTFGIKAYGKDSLPLKYDLRNENGVTAVKDQGNTNGCWAYASVSSLESNIKTKEKQEVDLSESDIMMRHGFDLDASVGGNMYMATAYMTRENDYNIEDVIFIPERNNFKDNDTLKKMVMEHGGVYTNLKWDDKSYNSMHQSYNNNTLRGYDHTVTIVGWDDAYSKDKFKNNENCQDGAFICKNSWGPTWGDAGYFYVSYYDYNIGKTDNAVFIGSANKDYDKIYQYDLLGNTKELGFATEEAWFSNVFTASADETVQAVSFYTMGENSDYEVWLSRNYKNQDSFSQKEKIKSGQLQTMGYHKIPIENIALNQGETVAVIVKVKTPNCKNPMAIESPKGSFSRAAHANKLESFVSVDGQVWTDLTELEEKANVCLKLFTKTKVDPSKRAKFQIKQVDKMHYTKGKEASVKVKIKNEETKPQKVALVVGLYDRNNKMVNHSYINQEIKGLEEIKLSASVFVPNDGKYILKGFVWDDSNHGICYMEEPIQVEIK